MEEMRASDPTHQIFCRNIRALRKAKGWTQEEAGKRLGVSQARYAEIEGGRFDPTLSLMTRVAKLYKHEASELLDAELTVAPESALVA
jgi:transcriptional regulator with XRE-family HTH domain